MIKQIYWKTEKKLHDKYIKYVYVYMYMCSSVSKKLEPHLLIKKSRQPQKWIGIWSQKQTSINVMC